MKWVTVLLSAYNGSAYIEEQLQSLFGQQGVSVTVIVRDDGSTDGTREILREYEKRGLLHWYCGRRLGPAESFMDLLYSAPESEYYAFCDQDDVWLPDKLRIAVACLETFPREKPALYYGRARLADRDLRPMKEGRTSPDRMSDLKSALINSNAIGCTMVFNSALLRAVAAKKPDFIAMHDGWLHKVCIALGGNLYFDEDVPILYRQHGDNLIGGDRTVTARVRQHLRSLRKKECVRSRTVRSLLACYGSSMPPEDYELCKLIAHYQDTLRDRLKLLFDRQIRTAYRRRNLLFKLAVMLGIF